MSADPILKPRQTPRDIYVALSLLALTAGKHEEFQAALKKAGIVP